MTEIYFDLPLIEWIGYAASTLVLISLSLSSIVKLRIYNLIGSALFSFYGFYIEALPVGIMNLLICFFNIYYLRGLLFKKEIFEGVWSNDKDEFLNLFLNYHLRDIQKFFPDFSPKQLEGGNVLLAVRDMKVAGTFVVGQPVDGIAEVTLDYVTPQYRDYKTGMFLLQKYQQELNAKGINQLVCTSENKAHIKYLQKIGFKLVGEQFVLNIAA